MKLSPATLAALARIAAAIGADASLCFRAGFDAVVGAAGERAAIRAGWAALQAAFTRSATGWAKRDAAVAIGDSVTPPSIACPSCSRVQPEFRCHSCGCAGPGVTCLDCRAQVRSGNCPTCKVLWNPVLAEEPEEGDTRSLITVPLTDLEIRSDKGIGYIVGWANSDRFDAHESYIMPDEVLPLIGADLTRIDEEHTGPQKGAVPGVRIEERWLGKRPIVDRETKQVVQATGVGVKIRFDLGVPEARAAYNSYDKGMKNPNDRDCLRGLSIGFYAPKTALAAWRSGATKTITPITSVPWLSMVRAPSNYASDVMELRSQAALERAGEDAPKPASGAPPANGAPEPVLPAATPAQTTTSTTVADRDVLSQMRQGLDPEDKPAGNEPPAAAPAAAAAQPPPASPPEARAPTASDPVILELNSRVDSHSTAIEELRARPQPRDWESEVRALEAVHGELRASLQSLQERAIKSDAHAEQIIKAIPALIREREQKIMAWVNRSIKDLTEPEERLGDPGDLDEIRAAESLRELEGQRAKEIEINWDVHAQSMLRLPA